MSVHQVGVASRSIKGIGALPGSYPIVRTIDQWLVVRKAQFTYTGPAQTLILGWGLKKGGVFGQNFNNGEGLQGGIYGFGVMSVPAGNNTPVTVSVDAAIHITDIIPDGTYDTFVWVSRDNSTQESSMLVIDTDAGIVKVTRPVSVTVSNLEVAYLAA